MLNNDGDDAWLAREPSEEGYLAGSLLTAFGAGCRVPSMSP